MKFSHSISSQFDASSRSRGYHYFLKGVVRDFEFEQGLVTAKVMGSRLYSVKLAFDHDELRVRCSCTYATGGGRFCKHMWAVVLTLDSFVSRMSTGLILPKTVVMARNDPSSVTRKGKGLKVSRQPMPGVERPAWKNWMQEIKRSGAEIMVGPERDRTFWPSGRKIFYILELESGPRRSAHSVTLTLEFSDPLRSGNWGKSKPLRMTHAALGHATDPRDGQILSLLLGAPVPSLYENYYGLQDTGDGSQYDLSSLLQEKVLPLMCQTGRCLLRDRDGSLVELVWDEGAAWELWLEGHPSGRGLEMMVSLRRGKERLQLLKTEDLSAAGGLVFMGGKAARLESPHALPWMDAFKKKGAFVLPKEQQEAYLTEFFQQTWSPHLDWPEEMTVVEETCIPQPCFTLRSSKKGQEQGSPLGEISFDYAGTLIPSGYRLPKIFQEGQRKVYLRDMEVERKASLRLEDLGLRHAGRWLGSERPVYEIHPKLVQPLIKALVSEGWRLEVEGMLYRLAGDMQIRVTSGVDWFDLDLSANFVGAKVKFPRLLAALRRGDSTVALEDGSIGVLPEAWIKKYGILAGLGDANNESLRFSRNQAGLLDALLISETELSSDAVFEKARQELRNFERITPAEAPSQFAGTLRDYQREGLGWMKFLQKFGFGGCLADDMGLGKTVQVLALLEGRRLERKEAKLPPSLIVVPKSLIDNWIAEAARFTPQLKILEHTGIERAEESDRLRDGDVILTTYGTLRRDILLFKDMALDYLILDESQAAKNANTQTAKCLRLLKGNHRLALSGTPVENHLGELWNLFEFLNPGMLGVSSVFKLAGTEGRDPDPAVRAILAKALRPFILRRTKEAVAKDLPQKAEMTLQCTMETAQRSLYDELRDHYRQVLMGAVDKDGLAKSKFLVLEALLRLRQAACHPGMIDKRRIAEPCAKLDVLMPQLEEVLEEGHKALVFSQFTSFLGILKHKLDQKKMAYEYLDGKTRNRGEMVERFQGEKGCKLFLISLKAGGLGLNLTAADYVFLLDPWWNPAVEAQAIDRSHRIGQTRQVFAYRLIAKDTVEEKVLELQKTKRGLAEGILNADESLLRTLTRKDLEKIFE